jgi:acyl-CoA synthetase (NDP forming)
VNKSLDAFFRPRGVAIIGASSRAGSPGYQILQHALGMGFAGKLYPINPKTTEILGLPVYKSVQDIPGAVDLALIMVSSQACLEVAGEIARRSQDKGDLKAVVIGSTGFSELGTEEGIKLETELMKIFRDQNIRVVGPNCVGIVDTYSGINTSFSVPPGLKKGGVSIVSQSGAFASSYLRWAKDLSLVGISKFISVGNMADVDVIDLFEFLAQDDSTKSIALYLEGTNKAREFIATAAGVSLKKPIVAIKSGRTSFGSSVALSHTGSIAGNDLIYDGAFRQAGIIRAASVEEFYHTARAFDKLPLPKGNRVCVLTGVGGPSAICVDELFASGLVQLAHISEKLKGKLKEILAPAAAIGKPDGYIDMTAATTEQLHHDVFKLLLADEGIDSIIFLNTPPGYFNEEKLAQAIISAYLSFPQEKRKPVLSVLLAGTAVSRLRRMLEEANLPTFEYPDTAARVMVNMLKYINYRHHFGQNELGVNFGNERTEG